MHNQRMIYDYACVSSNGQELAQQLAQLDAASCTKIYREKVVARLSSGPSSSALDAGNVLDGGVD